MMSLFLSDRIRALLPLLRRISQSEETRSANVRPPPPPASQTWTAASVRGELKIQAAKPPSLLTNDVVDGGVTPQRDFIAHNYY